MKNKIIRHKKKNIKSDISLINDTTIQNNGIKNSNGQSKKYKNRIINRFGRKFKSEIEMQFFIKLNKLKDDKIIDSFDYEKDKFLLIDTMRGMDNILMASGKPTINKTTYTPDFTVYVGGNIFYIDTKSNQTSKKESYVVKKKIFLYKYILGEKNKYFLEITTIQQFESYLSKINN